MFFSFWGKFGQRPNLTQTKYVYSQAELYRLILDQTKITSDFYIIDENTCLIDFQHDNDHIPDGASGNIVVAAFTTCFARLKLYEVLQKVDRNCLYYDTDSIIFVDDGSVDVQLGDYLGQLTNELENDEHIVEFVSGGPKNYSYLTNTGNTCCKVKGFSLNHSNSQRIHFESMKNIVLNRPDDKIVTAPQQSIARNKRKFELYNKNESKTYSVVYTKRQRLDVGFDTLPYGH